jgi:Protein of unknown function (DUF498/DUF598)
MVAHYVSRISLGVASRSKAGAPSRTRSSGQAGCASGTGTRPAPATAPGFSPPNVEELLEHGAEVVVLSKGIFQALQVCPETLELLKNKGIPAHVLQTEGAVRLYNELAEKQRVAGLFHSTC